MGRQGVHRARWRTVVVALVVATTVVALVCWACVARSAQRNVRARGASRAVPARVICLARHWSSRGEPTIRLLSRYHDNVKASPGVDGFDASNEIVFRRLGLRKDPNIMFTPGERGCAAAHLCVLEDMVREKIPILIVYVDDVSPSGPRREAYEVYWLLDALLGFSEKSKKSPELHRFVGIEGSIPVTRADGCKEYYFSQREYAASIVKRFMKEKA